MGIIFKLFKIVGIDISAFNNVGDTSHVLDPQKVVETGVDFVAVRSSYGKVIDQAFKAFWAALRGLVLRIQYHYMDYYSHVKLGLTPVQWGEIQAQTVFDATKDDNDGCIAFLDIEKASFAPKIEDVLSLVQVIAQAFLLKLDSLNGKVNGLYLSLSYLKYFLFAKHRPLWLALYNEYYTPEQAVALARSKGWTGPVYIWQYASDGDIDDDSLADGLKMGLESNFVDLNIWVNSEEAYNNFGKVTVTNPEPPVPLIPKTTTYQKGLTLVNGQNMRALPSATSPIVGTINAGIEIPILAYGKDIFGNPWLRIGHNQWIAQQYSTRKFVDRLYVE